MPPARKIKKENIIEITYKIVEKEGLKAVNARRIARELNCSVQPIFHNFRDMEELKEIVYEKIYETYKECMLSGIKEERPYKAMGKSYIQFAKDFPEFFKILFMQETNLKPEKFMMTDSIGEEGIRSGQKTFGLSYEEQKDFHMKVWLFTHGIATLIATNTVSFTPEEVDMLLTDSVRQMLIGYKQEKEEKKV